MPPASTIDNADNCGLPTADHPGQCVRANPFTLGWIVGPSDHADRSIGQSRLSVSLPATVCAVADAVPLVLSGGSPRKIREGAIPFTRRTVQGLMSRRSRAKKCLQNEPVRGHLLRAPATTDADAKIAVTVYGLAQLTHWASNATIGPVVRPYLATLCGKITGEVRDWFHIPKYRQFSSQSQIA